MNMNELKTALVENEETLSNRIDSLRTKRSLINNEIKMLLVEQKANGRMLVAAKGRTRK